MPIPTLGQISLDFATLRAGYPTYNRLPKHISDYMDALNKGNTGPRNTPCCFQVSEALNLAGAEHKIPARSYRRACARLGQNYYLGAVDELETYLTNRYGRGDTVYSGPAHGDIHAIKARLAGRAGIITFRDNGYGLHTELWNGEHIIQNGAPGSNGAGMSERGIFGVPRIVFWACTGDDARDPMPAWAVGWWQIETVTEPYYYYISDQYVVFYTTRRPENILTQPVRGAMMQGIVTLNDTRPGLSIQWEPSADGETTETYVLDAEPGHMTGSINNTLPALATKMTLAMPAPPPRSRR